MVPITLYWFTLWTGSAAVRDTDAVLVRDSKDTDKPALTVSPDAWSAFTALSADPRL
ncbi:DUF397 domain-containing protein [Streptomyces olivaceus]|uniref:DUF397 domain-containing protein n=1 Tax=Streptomyces olivaceus TaxID=47716 RepID=UPI0035571209|nr:DUF397 domain-containing protein [Streptomyces olivaceus]